MKNILIIALPRSGGTSIMHQLAEKHNLKARFEPELTQWPVVPKNDVTKIIVDRFSMVDIISIAENYDNIILHSRHDIESTAESLATMHHHWGDESYAEKPWHADLLKEVPQWYLEQTNHRIVHCQLLMHVLSDELKVPIQYYEDLFDLNSKERLRKDIDRTLL